MRRTLLFPLLAAFLLAPVARAQTDDAALAQRIDQAILKQGLGQFWGAVLVARDGKPIIAKGYGLAGDDAGGGEITADSLFDIGSIAKPFTALAILRLEARGKLATSDTVSRFFPGLGAGAEQVTLHHLLTHTSGMDDSVAIQRLDFPDRDEAIRRAMTSKFKTEPGAKFAYCNTGYIVLAAVIEKASGRGFQEFMRDEVFKPAGMLQTGFIDGEGLEGIKQTTRTVGPWYAPQRRGGIFVEPWGWGLRGAGGIATTMNDLIKWDRALAGDSLLGAELKEKYFSPEKNGYACGWFIGVTDSGTPKQSHTGGTRGYRCSLTRLPEENVVVAVLTNESGEPISTERLVLRELFPAAQLGARLFTAGLALNKHRSAEVTSGLRWKVSRAESGAVKIALELERDGSALADIALPAGPARGLSAQLIARAAGNTEDRGTMAMVGTMPYRADGEGVIVLPEGIEVVVMPGYSGRDDEGNVTSDERPTLVIQDRASSFWPLIVRMDGAVARKLAEDIKAIK